MGKDGSMAVKLEFYRGVKAMAGFLGLHPSTVERRLRDGKIPAKRDPMGTWVLCHLDYYQSLERRHGAVKG